MVNNVYAKAVYSALVAGLTALGVALLPEKDGAVVMTWAEWLAVALAVLISGGGVLQLGPPVLRPGQVAVDAAKLNGDK